MISSRPKRTLHRGLIFSAGFSVAFVLFFRSPLALSTTRLSLPLAETDQTLSSSSYTDTSNVLVSKQFLTFDGIDYQHRQIGNTSCYSRNNDSFCFPSLIIPGFQKSGSSALYFKLLRHPSILGHPKVKEWCPSQYNSTKATVEWARSEFLPEMTLNSSHRFLINGCLQYVANPDFFRTVAQKSKYLKVLVMVRNYADWAYSYYSYRCVDGYDSGCSSLRSVATLGPWKKNRNPTDFHELVVGASKGEKSRHPYFNSIRPSTWLYREFLTSIIATVGIENILILRQEDLTLEPLETLHKAARFIGVDENAFEKEAYSLVSNTNSIPAGKQNLPQNSSAQEATKVINSGHAMMMKTRKLLDRFWSEECEWLRVTHNIDYPETC